MKIISINNPEQFLKKIGTKNSSKNQKIVESILNDVKNNGDTALKKYEKKFGAGKISSLRVSQREITSAYSKVSAKDISAIKLAKSRLSKAESAIKRQFKDITIKFDGTKLSKSFVPIDSVGCYVPGGMARYPSSAVMSVTPAQIAGVKRIVVVSPPNSLGNIDPLTIVAADICGATEIYKTGGAQSIAALTYGTPSIKKVDKIVGPGGAFVTLAKYLVSNIVSIDMMAGPTELGIVIDSATDADLAALDLISQAEHSSDTFCYALTTSNSIAKKIQSSVNSKLQNIQRSKIVKSSLESNGFIGVCKASDIVNIVNDLAPEHLEIMSKNVKKWNKIKNPGLVLLGKNSPSSASDYLLGSNHILPTNGFGKTRGSLSVLDFVKLLTKVETSKKDLQKISKSMQDLTLAEGLPNHYEAVRGRL
ncbi:histidinol dehydrogenase [Candidatus Nitrosopumilus koreensis AR1]|uniref:Histidinol dehydrogenase n=1 Tax=Candidatus Nitrosopumilus koreensis AR1 TaxID=1229908 RepID=K0BAS9_9ARCH|nr:MULTISPECIES: histidinol dehydrogenase [Nitrosopumilus]AFS81551.1 histidinol dehydrogenase [Candidatus Nitrosopumilus koreensis AR1]